MNKCKDLEVRFLVFLKKKKKNEGKIKMVTEIRMVKMGRKLKDWGLGEKEDSTSSSPPKKKEKISEVDD